MMKRTALRTAALAGLLCTTVVPSGHARQVSRADLIDRGITAATAADAFASFTEAVNPAGGPVDAVWVRAIQYLTQQYYSEALTADDAGDPVRARRLRALGQSWMHWAVRFTPTFEADTSEFSEFLPEVGQAWVAARAGYSPDPEGDSLAVTQWTWSSAGPFDGSATVEIGPFSLLQPLRVNVPGQGSFGPGERRAIAAGTYAIEATAGADTVRVTRTLLPGMTTTLDFEPLARRLLMASGELPPSVLGDVLGAAVRLDVSRLDQSTCGTAVFASGDGLLLTTYRAIRGAESVTARLPDGTIRTDVTVAAYDVGDDVAVLRIDVEPGESLPLTDAAAAEHFAWAVGHGDCLNGDVFRTTVVESEVIGSEIVLADSVPTFEQFGPVVDGNGSIVGIISGPRRAIPVGRAQRVLESARLNVQIANLLSVDSVALVERHALGSMLVSSEVAGALGSITPLESWQWPETARTEFLPFTFTGPMGRYRLGILVDGAETDSTQFTISPRALEQFAHAIETTNQVAVQTGGGGFPVGVAVVGVLGAAGAAVALLMPKGDDGGTVTGPTTGGITIHLPIP